MSEFLVRVVEIGTVTKHPNADTLSITHIGGEGGYPVILRTGEFREGDKAVYVPITALVPLSDPRWSHLKDAEIRAVRLRGIFSMGILTHAEPDWELGQEVSAELSITRAEKPEPVEGNERDPGLLPVYTDIPSLRANTTVLVEGEEVIITEKIHGECARFVYDNGRLYCGSRTSWKDPAATQKESKHWWETARRLRLEEKLRVMPYGVFGEIYGDVRGMKYGATSSERGLRLFDAMDTKTHTYLNYNEFESLAHVLRIPTAPVLYRGPWKLDLRSLAEGNSTIAVQHVREGMVVRPVVERWDDRLGRVILKLHGEGFLTRKHKRG